MYGKRSSSGWAWRSQCGSGSGGRAHRLLLLWMGLLFLPAFLADTQNTMRMVGAVPAIYLLVAVGVWETFQWSASRILAGEKYWPPIFGTVLSIILLTQGAITYRAVFENGMVDSYSHYDKIWPTFAQRLNARPAEKGTVYFITHQRYDAFDYLYQGATLVVRTFPDVLDLDHHIEASLAEIGDVSTVKVVNWVDWSPTIEWRSNYNADLLTILLDKYGRHVATEDFDGIHVDSYVDISLNRPWVLFEDLPRPVIYDGGITLEGLALGSSRVRLPRRQRFDAEQNRSLRFGMLCGTDSELAVDYSISLRLYNDDGARVFQNDHVLRKP